MKTVKGLARMFALSLIVCSLYACGALRRQPAATATTAPTKAIPSATATLPRAQSGQAQEYLQVFEEVWSTVNATFYDEDFGGVDWDAMHEQYAPLIGAAADDQTFYQLLNQMLWELGVSHFGVLTMEMWTTAEPVTFGKGETGMDVRLVDEQALVTRVKPGSPAAEAGMRPGYIIQSIEGMPVDEMMRVVQDYLPPPYNPAGRLDGLMLYLLGRLYGEPGSCVQLTYLDEMDDEQTKCIERIQRPREVEMSGLPLPPFHLEFESGYLEGGIGYLRFNTFHLNLLPEMIAAVAAMQDAPGMIIDLRGNPGGEPDVADQLAAQFLVGAQGFGSFKIRSGVIPRMVNGVNRYSGPLVILVDYLSYSGSEYFSAGMQGLGRAVIIGERTPGGASGMNLKILSNGAVLGYNVFAILGPDGSMVEGRGIIPDVPATLERSELLAGVDGQLQAALYFLNGSQR